MNTYCPVRPRHSSTSARTCSGPKATQLTTASKSLSPTASRTDWPSLTSARCTVAASGSGRSAERPRWSTCRAPPSWTASCEHAELITPLPPMNKTFNALMAAKVGPVGSGRRTGAQPDRGSAGQHLLGEANDDGDDTEQHEGRQRCQTERQ